MDYRVPVAVRLRVDTNGTVQPKTIEWPDGREFDIVRVGGRTRTVDRESGEIGWCYEVTLSLMKRDEARRLYRFGPIWYVYCHSRYR